MLADYQQPALDPGILEGLNDYIARKKESLPDQNY
jgi:trimethylamine--corrinoid protein Co-methyltransferase